ncbi:hypothetical protein ILUMI_08931 [Ignelater luminosus]|uniref:DDE Tnp4 domain-containing protein n=1 Tax=Ignelater luminosus TaxID=2038154 RepID=A0A8K0D614_IGNLU|nr:hypothetical protein ILUMI_08931 [Ignelater luminosus]
MRTSAYAWVKFPTTNHAKQHNKLRFYEIFEDEEVPGRLFINRKDYHSINCKVICEAVLKILAVNERYFVSVHDAAIWSTSAIYHRGY